MEKLLHEHKIKIELIVYPSVLAYVEVIMCPKGKEERNNAINSIVNLIKTFSENNELDINCVKEYLLEILELDIEENKKNNQKMFSKEYENAKEILEKDVR